MNFLSIAPVAVDASKVDFTAQALVASGKTAGKVVFEDSLREFSDLGSASGPTRSTGESGAEDGEVGRGLAGDGEQSPSNQPKMSESFRVIRRRPESAVIETSRVDGAPPASPEAEVDESLMSQKSESKHAPSKLGELVNRPPSSHAEREHEGEALRSDSGNLRSGESDLAASKDLDRPIAGTASDAEKGLGVSVEARDSQKLKPSRVESVESSEALTGPRPAIAREPLTAAKPTRESKLSSGSEGETPARDALPPAPSYGRVHADGVGNRAEVVMAPRAHQAAKESAADSVDMSVANAKSATSPATENTRSHRVDVGAPKTDVVKAVSPRMNTAEAEGDQWTQTENTREPSVPLKDPIDRPARPRVEGRPIDSLPNAEGQRNDFRRGAEIRTLDSRISSRDTLSQAPQAPQADSRIEKTNAGQGPSLDLSPKQKPIATAALPRTDPAIDRADLRRVDAPSNRAERMDPSAPASTVKKAPDGTTRSSLDSSLVDRMPRMDSGSPPVRPVAGSASEKALEMPDSAKFSVPPSRSESERALAAQQEVRHAAPRAMPVASQGEPHPVPLSGVQMSIYSDPGSTSVAGRGVTVSDLLNQQQSEAGEQKERKHSKREQIVDAAITARIGTSGAHSGVPRPVSLEAAPSVLMQRVIESIEQMSKAVQRNNIRLSVELEGGEQVRVALRVSNHSLKTVIHTESEALRIALREGWDQFQKQIASKGLDAQFPDFSSSGSRGGERERAESEFEESIREQLSEKRAITELNEELRSNGEVDAVSVSLDSVDPGLHRYA